MFWNVLRLERDKIFKRRMTWIIFATLALLIAAAEIERYIYRAHLERGAAQGLIWPGGLVNVLGFVGGNLSLGTLLLVVLLGIVTAQEYSWRSMQLWLSRGIPRPLLLGTKFIISLAPTLLLTFIGLLVGGGLTAIFSYALHGTLFTNQVDFGHVLLGYLISVYTMLPYIALTFMLAVVTRSTVVAVSGTLAFMLVVETIIAGVFNLIGGTFANVASYLPGSLANDLFAQDLAIAKLPIPSTTLSPTVAAIGIAVYILAFCGVAMWAFQRQDLAS